MDSYIDKNDFDLSQIVDVLAPGLRKNLANSAATVAQTKDVIAQSQKAVSFIGEHWLGLIIAFFVAIVIADIIAQKIVS